MKKVIKYGNNKALKRILMITCAILFFTVQKSVCFADATGKVTAPSAKIRKSADISSEVIGSSSQGKTITITAEVTDASGTVWYEVYVDSNTRGYIRSDLVDKDASSGEVPSRTAQSSDASASDANQGNTASTSSDAQTPVQSTASGAQTPAQTPMDAQYASVKVPAAKVRGDASTTEGVVDTIPQGTQVVVSGKSTGSDGREWYYITFTGTGGQEKNGYVRNDLVDLGEMVPASEPQEPVNEDTEPREEPEEVQEDKDYDMVFENGEWYFYNNLEGTKNKLSEIMEAVEAQELNESIDDSTITKQRIAIIVLVSIIIIMAFAMTLMIFKIRDAYYEAYEDDEGEDDTAYNNKREDVNVRRSTGTRESKPVQSQTQTRKRTMESEKRMPVREVTYEEEIENQIKPAPRKKAKNFMIDDEDFEFEFLNMKNKDVDR